MMGSKIALLTPGAIFGEEVVKKSDFYEVTAIAASSSTFVYQISKERYHGTITQIYKEAALAIVHNLKVKLRWRDKRIKRLRNEQQQLESNKQLALNSDHQDQKTAQSAELDRSAKKTTEFNSRREYNGLFTQAQARVGNLDLPSPGKGVDGQDLATKKSGLKRSSPVHCKPLLQAKRAHEVLRSLMVKQKIEEKNTNNSIQELAKTRSNDLHVKTPTKKEQTAFSEIYEASYTEPSEVRLAKETSLVRSITFRITAPLLTSPKGRNRAFSTQRRSLRKWNQFTESNSRSFLGDTSRGWKAFIVNTALKPVPSNEPTLPINFQRIQNTDHSSLADISTGETERRSQLTQQNETLINSQSSPFTRRVKKVDNTTLSQYPTFFTEPGFSKKQKLIVQRPDSNAATRSLICSKHNMFRMKPRREYLLEKYSVNSSINLSKRDSNIN